MPSVSVYVYVVDLEPKIEDECLTIVVGCLDMVEDLLSAVDLEVVLVFMSFFLPRVKAKLAPVIFPSVPLKGFWRRSEPAKSTMLSKLCYALPYLSLPEILT